MRSTNDIPFETSYLELLQLTKLFILQEFAKEKKYEEKRPPPPISYETQKRTGKEESHLAKPTSEESVAPPTLEVSTCKSIEKGGATNSETDIQKLLKSICPALQLRSNPLKTLDNVLILVGTDLEEEKTLLENMAQALKNRGISATALSISSPLPNFFEAPFPKAVIAAKKLFLENDSLRALARRDENNRPFIGNSPLVVIPDIQLFLQNPPSRKQWWDQLMLFLGL